MKLTRRSLAAAGLALAAVAGPQAAFADDRSELNAKGVKTLQELERQNANARLLAAHAAGILVFPSVVKAGFIIGAESGNGVLFEHGRPTSYYNIGGGSLGLQAGGQDFAYVLFFMRPSGVQKLKASQGWSLGTEPGLVVVNQGAQTTADVQSMARDIYAFPFNGKGLMASLSLEGTKISRIHPS